MKILLILILQIQKKKTELESHKIYNNIKKQEINEDVQKIEYGNIVEDLDIKENFIDNKNKCIKNNYIKFGDLNIKIGSINNVNKINYKINKKRKNTFNEINDLSSYISKYLI